MFKFTFFTCYMILGVSSGHLQEYPMSLFFTNIYEGFLCIFYQEAFISGDIFDNKTCDCSLSLLFYILIYVISTIFVLECINKIVQSNTIILNRVMSTSVITSFIALGFYGLESTREYVADQNHIGFADIIALVLLLAGMEIYGNEQEPDIEYLTNST